MSKASCVRRGTSAEPDGRVNRSFRLIAGIIKTWQSIILYSVSEPESPFDCTGFRLIQANTSQLNIYMRWYESCLFNLLLQSICLAFLLLKRQNIDKEKAELIFLLGFDLESCLTNESSTCLLIKRVQMSSNTLFLTGDTPTRTTVFLGTQDG